MHGRVIHNQKPMCIAVGFVPTLQSNKRIHIPYTAHTIQHARMPSQPTFEHKKGDSIRRAPPRCVLIRYSFKYAHKPTNKPKEYTQTSGGIKCVGGRVSVLCVVRWRQIRYQLIRWQFFQLCFVINNHTDIEHNGKIQTPCCARKCV